MEFRHSDENALGDYFKHTFQKKLLLYMPQREKEHLTPATQILEKRRELEEVEKARKAEKEEFRMKMESLAARRDEIEIRENQLKESLLKFDTFIRENDAKLTRARNKANRERESILQKEDHIDVLKIEKGEMEQKLRLLKEEVDRYAKYHDFLREVMTEGGGYDEPRAVMTRHKTLTTLLVQLRCKEKLRGAVLEAFRRNMSSFREELEDIIMVQHNTISKLQKDLEVAQGQAMFWENEYNQALSTTSEKTMLEGKLRMAARNLYIIVRTRMKRPTPSEDFAEQMKHVHNYMSDLISIIHELCKDDKIAVTIAKKKEMKVKSRKTTAVKAITTKNGNVTEKNTH
ncbi:hypothetical protein ACOMHN_001473 [Nucella lapillus]